MTTPVYPDEAREAGAEGMVRVEVTIGSRGEVLEARALRSKMTVRSGEYDVPYRNRRVIEEIEAAAVKAVMKWKFEPAQKEGKPVESTVVIPLEFSMNR